MENENLEVLETQNNQDEVVINEEETLTPEEIADLKHKAEVSSQNFERAKKAEAEKKALEAQLNSKGESSNTLSSKDILAIANAKIHEDDIDGVIEYAKFKKISVSEALKSGVIKATLAENEEVRQSANVANTRNASRGSSQVSVERLLSEANAGKLPERDEDIQRMMKEKMKKK